MNYKDMRDGEQGDVAPDEEGGAVVPFQASAIREDKMLRAEVLDEIAPPRRHDRPIPPNTMSQSALARLLNVAAQSLLEWREYGVRPNPSAAERIWALVEFKRSGGNLEHVEAFTRKHRDGAQVEIFKLGLRNVPSPSQDVGDEQEKPTPPRSRGSGGRAKRVAGLLLGAGIAALVSSLVAHRYDDAQARDRQEVALETAREAERVRAALGNVQAERDALRRERDDAVRTNQTAGVEREALAIARSATKVAEQSAAALSELRGELRNAKDRLAQLERPEKDRERVATSEPKGAGTAASAPQGGFGSGNYWVLGSGTRGPWERPFNGLSGNGFGLGGPSALVGAVPESCRGAGGLALRMPVDGGSASPPSMRTCF
jgi:hypothetical protein